jgi:peptidyl-prolyl cis-trans isomerase B (cyclophilin B)
MSWSYRRTRGERATGPSLRYPAVRLLPVGLLVVVLALAGCGGSDDEEEGGGEDTQTEQAASGCKQVQQPPAKRDGGEEKPAEELDPNATYEVTFQTNCGDFTISLDPRLAPEATASFLALAESGFYDETNFHRVVPGFVVQGGDPTGSGSGGPGYTTRDEPPRNAQYTKGVVAMAKAGNEPAGTAGSQFFVVTGDDAGLPPDYTVIGEVTAGMDTVDRLGQRGDPATEQPTEPLVIEKTTVRTA